MDNICSQDLITKLVNSNIFSKNFIQERRIETNLSKPLNALIKGENLRVLKILENTELCGKVDVIYIDPNYNNKNTKLTYSDGQIPHEKWLEELDRRIVIAIRMLNKNDGLLAISIDDTEYHRVRLLLEKYYCDDEVQTIVVKVAEPTGNKMYHVKERGAIAKLKEYLILAKYNGVINMNLEKRNKEQWDENYDKVIENVSKNEIGVLKKIMKNKSRTKQDIAMAEQICAKFYLVSLNKKLIENNLTNDEKKNAWRIENSWRIVRTCSTNTNIKMLADKKKKSKKDKFFTVISPKNEMHIIKSDYNSDVKQPRIKILFADDYLCMHLGDIWDDIKTTGLSREGSITFINGKKALKFLKRIVNLTARKDLVILDLFSGSGTLGQAILEVNKSDEGMRSFILIEKDKDTCENIILTRIENSLFGRNNCIKTSGNLLYCKIADEEIN